MRHGPKCKIQNYKTSRRQDRRNLGDSGFSDKFLDRRTKTESIKQKKTWTLLILKALYSVKASINRMKKQVTGWENIFANTHQIKVLHMKYPKDLLLQHHHPHGLHARSREGPVPVGSALLPERPHLAEADSWWCEGADLQTSQLEEPDFLTNLCDLRDSYDITQVCFVKAIKSWEFLSAKDLLLIFPRIFII